MRLHYWVLCTCFLMLSRCTDENPITNTEKKDNNNGTIDTTNVGDGMGDMIFARGMLHKIDIVLPDSSWQAINKQAADYAVTEEGPKTYFEASLTYDNLPQLQGVGVRIKGNHQLANAAEFNKSLPLKVDFDRFTAKQKLDGLKKLNLHALVDEDGEWEWPSDPIADYVSYSAMREYGAKTSRVAIAEVSVNGISQGLYSVVEQISGTFIKSNFPKPQGDLYKPDESLTYEGDVISKYPEIGFKWPDTSSSNHQSLIKLTRALSQGSDAELEQVLDIDGALTYFALNIGLGNWDYYTFITHNYYLYEITPGKFTVIPWDMNMSQVNWTDPCGAGAGDKTTPLSYRLLGNPVYVKRYANIMKDFLEGAGSVSAQNIYLDEIVPHIGKWISSQRIEELRDNISQRVLGILSQVDNMTVCPENTGSVP